MPENLLQASLSNLLNPLSVRPQLLALGEPTHGLQIFPHWRNQIFQTLVEKHGFRSIALESDILAGLDVDSYVSGKSGTLDKVMASGFSHGFGTSTVNRELVEWLRKFNVGRSGEEQVRFYGFDAPMENRWAASPRPNLLALNGFLTAHLGDTGIVPETLETLCGEDARWTNEAAAINPIESVGNTPQARELRLLADDMQTLLQRETPRLHQLIGFWKAQLHARTALGLLRYHANMARTSASRLPTMLALRDLMMADNLQAIAEREQKHGPTLVFAHNLHLQRGVSGMNMSEQRMEWWGAGAHLSTRLGGGYAFIASGMGRAEALGIGKSAPDTIEGQLMTLPDAVSLLPRAELKKLTMTPLITRTDFPPQAFPLTMSLLDGIDGLLFVKNAEEIL